MRISINFIAVNTNVLSELSIYNIMSVFFDSKRSYTKIV